jgi:phospholipid-translocating ATPase
MTPIPYRYLIPILYVSIELVKVLQAHFINWDIHMFDEETGNTTQVRTSNLNEPMRNLVGFIQFCLIKLVH